MSDNNTNPIPVVIIDGAFLYRVNTTDGQDLAVYIYPWNGDKEVLEGVIEQSPDLLCYNEDYNILCLKKVKNVDVDELVFARDSDPFESILIAYWNDFQDALQGEVDFDEASEIWNENQDQD